MNSDLLMVDTDLATSSLHPPVGEANLNQMQATFAYRRAAK